MISFGQPLWLYGLAVAAIILTAWAWWTDRRSRRLLERFVASSLVSRLTLSFSRPRQRVKSGLSVLACLLLILALARPQWGSVTEEIELQGVDILFALDASRSMLAEDYPPNRLARAKLSILDLVTRMDGDRVGLIAFAGDAFLQCPLTLDYSSFLLTLDSLDTDTIPRGGSNIAAAIDEASAYFAETDHQKVLILISDGEDLEASGILRAREAANDGILIFTIGVGSPEGELIPIRTPGKQVDYVRDHTQKPVRTRLDEESLRTIAQITGGTYQRLAPSGTSALDEVYAAARATVDAETTDSMTRETPIERYSWVLALGLLCLVTEWLLGNRRRSPTTRPASAALLLFAVLSAFLTLAPSSTHASPRAAESAYRAGDFEKAIALWSAAIQENPDNARLHYNLGNAYYSHANFPAAIDAYQKALPLAGISLQAHIFYNLANAEYNLGQKTIGEAPARTRDLWEDALQNYANSLALSPQAEDAARNQQLVKEQFAVHGARVEVSSVPENGGTTSEGGLFLPGMVLELHAEANEGWRFTSWQGAEVEDPEKANTTMTILENVRVAAVFVETRQLTVLSANPDQGTAGKSGRYDLDGEVPIKAEPADFFALDHWVSDTLEIADPAAQETTVKLTGDGTVTATFTDAFRLQVLSEPTIAGNVGTTGFYKINSEVPIQAEARPGFQWLGWIGEGIADRYEPETSVTLDQNRNILGQFERIWSLVVLPDRDESGTTTGGGNFPIGATQPIEATPKEGFTFSHWEGPGVQNPESPQTTVHVLSDEQDVIAVFEQEDGDDQDESSSDESEPDESDESDQSDSESKPDESDEPEPQNEPEEPDEPEETPEPEAAPEEPTEEAEERATPESLTGEEARQLLQTLRQDERQLPLRIRPPSDEEATTGRDW